MVVFEMKLSLCWSESMMCFLSNHFYLTPTTRVSLTELQK